MPCFDNGEIQTRIRLSGWTAAARSALKDSPFPSNTFPFSAWEAHILENEWFCLLPSENNASLLIRRCFFNESLVVHGQKKSMVVSDLFNGGGSIDAVCCCCQLRHDVGFHVETFQGAVLWHHYRCSLQYSLYLGIGPASLCRQLCSPSIGIQTSRSSLVSYWGWDSQLSKNRVILDMCTLWTGNSMNESL